MKEIVCVPMTPLSLRRPRKIGNRLFPKKELQERYDLKRITLAEAQEVLSRTRGKVAMNRGCFVRFFLKPSLTRRIYCCPYIRSLYALCPKQ